MESSKNNASGKDGGGLQRQGTKIRVSRRNPQKARRNKTSGLDELTKYQEESKEKDKASSQSESQRDRKGLKNDEGPSEITGAKAGK
jgi:hypothetical protein